MQMVQVMSVVFDNNFRPTQNQHGFQNDKNIKMLFMWSIEKKSLLHQEIFRRLGIGGIGPLEGICKKSADSPDIPVFIFSMLWARCVNISNTKFFCIHSYRYS